MQQDDSNTYDESFEDIFEFHQYGQDAAALPIGSVRDARTDLTNRANARSVLPSSTTVEPFMSAAVQAAPKTKGNRGNGSRPPPARNPAKKNGGKLTGAPRQPHVKKSSRQKKNAPGGRFGGGRGDPPSPSGDSGPDDDGDEDDDDDDDSSGSDGENESDDDFTRDPVFLEYKDLKGGNTKVADAHAAIARAFENLTISLREIGLPPRGGVHALVAGRSRLSAEARMSDAPPHRPSHVAPRSLSLRSLLLRMRILSTALLRMRRLRVRTMRSISHHHRHS